MERRTHTPGPWRTFNGTDVFPDDDDTGGERHIADCMPVSDAISYAERAANARLIAAAPELLAALKDAERAIIDGIEAQTGREYRERDAIPALHKVRTAIARAEGR